MATGADVLGLIIPDGGWYISGNEYAGIQFLECEPITEAQFIGGFAQYDAWKTEQETKKAAEKAALLERLGITAEEATLLLG